MTALRILFSSDVFLPRGYALGWEPVLLVTDGVSQLLLGAGGAALFLRARKRRRIASKQGAEASSEAAVSRPGLGLFGALLALSALVDLVGLWRAWPGLSALLRAAAGTVALFAASRAPKTTR